MFDHQGAAVLHFQTIHIDHQLGVTCQFVFGSLENMMVQYIFWENQEEIRRTAGEGKFGQLSSASATSFHTRYAPESWWKITTVWPGNWDAQNPATWAPYEALSSHLQPPNPHTCGSACDPLSLGRSSATVEKGLNWSTLSQETWNIWNEWHRRGRKQHPSWKGGTSFQHISKHFENHAINQNAAGIERVCGSATQKWPKTTSWSSCSSILLHCFSCVALFVHPFVSPRVAPQASAITCHNWVAWRYLERSKDHRQDLVVPDTTCHSELPAPIHTIPWWWLWWWWRWWWGWRRRRLVVAACSLQLAACSLQVGACRLVPNTSESYVYFNRRKYCGKVFNISVKYIVR